MTVGSETTGDPVSSAELARSATHTSPVVAGKQFEPIPCRHDEIVQSTCRVDQLQFSLNFEAMQRQARRAS